MSVAGIGASVARKEDDRFLKGRGQYVADDLRRTGALRARWEGNTFVVDVTIFSPKTDVFGSRQNLGLVERWTRTGPRTLAYEATIEDPTVWTRPWTVKQEFCRQSDQEPRVAPRGRPQ
jgi:hypothetical protein